MAAKRKFSQETIRNILDEFYGDLTTRQIGTKYNCDFVRTIRPLWRQHYTSEQLKERFSRMCAASKTGDSNPMAGKAKELHPRHVPKYKSTQGYTMVDAPDWYEGPRKGSKVLEHVIVGCEKYGLKRLPPKHVIHHIDHSRDNNHPDNLQLMTIAAHMAHHKNRKRKVPEEGATTIPQGSREDKMSPEARSILTDDDIV